MHTVIAEQLFFDNKKDISNKNEGETKENSDAEKPLDKVPM